MSSTVFGVLVFAIGINCLVSAILGRETALSSKGSNPFFFETILGKHYGLVINLLLGTLCTAGGFKLCFNLF